MTFLRHATGVVTLSLLLPCAVRAQAPPAFLAVSGIPLVSDIIRQAREAASILIHQAEESGNAVAGRFGNELNVAATDAELLAADQLNKQVGALSDQNKIIMSRLSDLTTQANAFLPGAWELKDALVLDLRSVLPPIVGGTFYVQRIDGVTQLNREAGDYVIKIMGLGLGPASGSDLAFTIRDTAKPVRIQQVQANTAELFIPHNILEPYFDPRQVRVVRVSVEIDQTHVTGLTHRRKHHHYSVPLWLTLMPVRAGTVTVTALVPRASWHITGDTSKEVKATPDLDGRPAQVTSFSISVAGDHSPPVIGDKRFHSWSFLCIRPVGGVCAGWLTILHVTPSDGDTKVTAAVSTNSWSATWQLTGIVEAYLADPPDTVRQDLDINYGRDLVISLPAGATQIRITGKTITGDPIDLVSPQSGGLLKFGTLNVDENHTTTNVVYAVLRPNGVP